MFQLTGEIETVSAQESSEEAAAEVLSSKEEEAKLTKAVEETKLILTEIKAVSVIVNLVLTQSLSGTGEEVNIAILLTKIIIISTGVSDLCDVLSIFAGMF